MEPDNELSLESLLSELQRLNKNERYTIMGLHEKIHNTTLTDLCTRSASDIFQKLQDALQDKISLSIELWRLLLSATIADDIKIPNDVIMSVMLPNKYDILSVVVEFSALPLPPKNQSKSIKH